MKGKQLTHEDILKLEESTLLIAINSHRSNKKE